MHTNNLFKENICVLVEDAFGWLSFFSMKFASTNERHSTVCRHCQSHSKSLSLASFPEDIITLLSNLLHVRKVTYS